MADSQTDQGSTNPQDAALSDTALDEVGGGLLPMACPKCGQDFYSGHTC